MTRLVARRLVAGLPTIALILAAQSCGSGSGGSGSISLALSASSAIVARDGEALVVGTVTRSGGFTGDVAITITGAPSGVTGSAGTLTTVGTTSTAIVTIPVGVNAAPGTYALTARASGSGVLDATVPFTLTILDSVQNYTLSASPTAVMIGAGTGGSATVIINRGGYTGVVSLSVTNPPPGFAAIFSPNNTTGDGSLVMIAVDSSVTAGVYQLTISGVASGQRDQSVQLTVAVTAAGSFSVSAAPSPLTVLPGSSNSANVTVTRGSGVSGNMTLTATGNPAALSAIFSPRPDGASFTMTMIASPTLALGSYVVTIHASAAGVVGEQTTSITVNVTANPFSNNVTLDFSACAASLQPVWFAYQDGTDASGGGPGAWTVVIGSNNVYQFPIQHFTGGVAYTTLASGAMTQINVTYYESFRLTAAPLVFCLATVSGANSMQGTVAGLAAGEQATVSLNNAAAVSPYPTTSYTLNQLSSGVFDLVAWRTNVGSGPSASDRLIIRRSQAIVNAGTIPVLDFGSAESVAPLPGTITVTGAGTGQITAQMAYYTSGCISTGPLYSLGSPGPTFTAYGVSPSSQLGTDFHDLSIGVTNGMDIRSVQNIFHSMGDRTVVLPPALDTPAITSLPGTYKRLQATYAVPLDYTIGSTGTSFTYVDETGAHGVALRLASNYVGASVALAMPQFSGLFGFLDSWAPASSATTTWTVQVNGSNILTNACNENGRYVTDQVSGSN